MMTKRWNPGTTGRVLMALTATALLSSTLAPAIASAQTPKVIEGHVVEARLTLRATAYGPSAQDNYPYGATDFYGHPLKAGMVAVDPSRIPLGTKLYITGYQSPDLKPGGFVATAADTGGAIQGSRVDIFMNAGAATVSGFGEQTVTAYILGPAVGKAEAKQAGPG